MIKWEIRKDDVKSSNFLVQLMTHATTCWLIWARRLQTMEGTKIYRIWVRIPEKSLVWYLISKHSSKWIPNRKPVYFFTHGEFRNCQKWCITYKLTPFFSFFLYKKGGFNEVIFIFVDDNIDETYGVNVQFESDEEVSFLFIFFFIFILVYMHKYNRSQCQNYIIGHFHLL